MRVGYFQFEPVFGEPKRNLDYVCAQLAKVTADLIVLPELFSSGYQFVSKAEVEALAESVPDGPTLKRLKELAGDRRLFLVAGIPERSGDRYYNSAVIVGPTGFLGLYRKTHLFFEETLFFSPGDTGFLVWDAGEVRLGVMICFDWF
jgi:predicted amidohydrolase